MGCWAGIPEAKFTTFNGSCQRYGDTGLHQFAKRWVERMANLGPPDVPTTCMYITDVNTPLAWKYHDFLSKGQLVKSGPGDGTVNAESAEAPCRLWQSTQEAPVRLMPLRLGGASHV